MKRILLITAVAASFCGCQNPRTSYMNGVVVWMSSSAIGFGFGEYIEVPAGGELYRTTTNSAPCVWKDGVASGASVIDIRNAPVAGDEEEKPDADKAEME
ncbi:MAG: hypothetical protein E7046_11685 [Lentisphaerae bacterium]|nr:hypothetical protein [Lentisphaerota bacterium]